MLVYSNYGLSRLLGINNAQERSPTTNHRHGISNHSMTNHSQLLLSVPFYVYERLAWTNATFGNDTLETMSKPGNQKHIDEFLFMKSSLIHPMRTKEPTEAKIFVIPILMNQYASREYYTESRLCYGSICNFELLKTARDLLKDSVWLQAYPEGHIVVLSHYSGNKFRKDWRSCYLMSTRWRLRIKFPIIKIVWDSRRRMSVRHVR